MEISERSLGQIEWSISEWQQIKIPWQVFEIHHSATDTAFNKDSKSLQYNISQLCCLDKPNMKLIQLQP